VGSEVAAWN